MLNFIIASLNTIVDINNLEKHYFMKQQHSTKCQFKLFGCLFNIKTTIVNKFS